MDKRKEPVRGFGMSTLPWIKLHLDLLNDSRLGQLPESARLRYIELMLLAGEYDAEGYLSRGDRYMTIEDLAWRLRIAPERIKADIEALLEAGLLEVDEGCFLLPDFSERQGRMLSEKRASDRQRQARSRAKRRTVQALEYFAELFGSAPTEEQAEQIYGLVRRYGLKTVKAGMAWAKENGYRTEDVGQGIESSPALLVAKT